MKKSLVLFIFFMMHFSQMNSQVSTILPCNSENYEMDSIQIKIVFDKHGALKESKITSLPSNILCDSRYYVYATVINQSSAQIEKVEIENLVHNRTPNTTMGGIVPIIIKPVPPKSCVKAVSDEPIEFSNFQRSLTTKPLINFEIRDVNGASLDIIQKEFEYAGNAGELEIQNATASIEGKINIRWDVINYGCNLNTSFSSNVYISKDSIFDKSDLKIATRNTLLTTNTGSEQIAILHSFINYQRNRFVIIEIDSNNDIIENNEANNIVVIEAFKNKGPVVYPKPVINTVNFTFETKKNTPSVIYIFDQFGRVRNKKKHVFRKNSPTCTLDLSQLKRGLYFYKMISKGSIYSGNLIKK